MSDKICIFAGTTEGRKLASLLAAAADVNACVATEYGQIMLDGIENITIHSGRMDKDEMKAFFKVHHFSLIIDATHPYAQIVTENIASAADENKIPLIRILREKEGNIPGAVYVSTVFEAKKYLSEHEGNILITTGSKELSDFTGLDMPRVWARVLPAVSSLEACERVGIPVSHIIAAQGPFTMEVNLAQLKMIGAKYIVTKSSGSSGGFEEKIRAASEYGAVPVIIGQPNQVTGLTLDEAIAELGKKYHISKRKITLIGIGPGDAQMLTLEAYKAIERCDAVLGAASVIEALNPRKPCFNEYSPAKVRQVLDAHPSIRDAAVVFRGDTGFFSGATEMIKEFADDDITVIPGISSLTSLSAKLGVSWDNAVCMSLHGRDGNFVNAVEKNKKVFLLTGGENTPSAVCKKLKEYGFGELVCTVGERLSYPDEKITKESISALSEGVFDPLSVMLIENPDSADVVRIGIDDGEFIRGDVPMTKAEVRAISISKLALHDDSVVWDIGAGTGSVSVECALAANRGQVYAIEKEPDAIELIKCNKLKFKADNISIVSGSAPEILAELPVPTHAFIGGTNGNLRSILNALLDKNPDVKIVMNAVTLESQSEAFACAKEYGFENFEAVSVNISRTKKAGSYNLMAAQNPVTVFVMQKGRTDD